MNLLINDSTDGLFSDEYRKIIFDVLERALEIEDIKSNPEISISIVKNDEIQLLNKKFRGIDRPTDVLSFPLIDFNGYDKNVLIEENVLLGDIVISIEKVFEQAKSYNHSVERELGFLVAHGILHLLGYDHINSEDEEIMFDKQNIILLKVGLKR